MKYKSKQKKREDMIRGKNAEKEYARIYSGATDLNNIEFSTEQEDIKQHWDVSINGVKIDVKAIKKDNENIHFVEFKNVLGNKGWLYGDADGFAFETRDYWIEVAKEDLQEMVHDKCIDKVKGWDFYELSSRPGAKDLFTKVKTLDLCFVGKMKKKK
tara:strand:+ start:688 stop:1158 length:471 start_codon:yes stop_codon:yes gene_type:complete